MIYCRYFIEKVWTLKGQVYVHNNAKIVLHSVFQFLGYNNTKCHNSFFIYRKIYTGELRKKFQQVSPSRINVKIIYSFFQFSKNIKLYAIK
jgi:hypothetical protein